MTLFEALVRIKRALRSIAPVLAVLLFSSAAQAQVYFEAECGITGNVWTAASDSTASEGSYVRPTAEGFFFRTETIPEPLPDILTFNNIIVPTVGSHELWVRVRTQSVGGSLNRPGFNFRYNNENLWYIWYTSSLTYANFTWVNLATVATINRSGVGIGYNPIVTSAINESVKMSFAYVRQASQLDKFALIPVGGSAPTGTGPAVGGCGDFGDAPDTTTGNGTGDYTTLFAGNSPPGAFNNVDPSPAVYLGNVAPDTESDAAQNPTATGDDSSDEGEAQLMSTGSGNVFPALSINSSSYSINIDVTNSKAVDAQLMAWIDFDRNGVFDEDERSDAVTVSASAGSTQQTITWSGLSSLSAGATFMRLRLSTDPLFVVGGTAASVDAKSLDVVIDGETEDHQITLFASDFGDAPLISTGAYDDTDGSGGLNAADTPAEHLIVAGINLGADPDADTGVWANGTDTNQNATDDDNEGSDDEDGLTITALRTDDSSYSLQLAVNNGDAVNSARVLAWLDFDQNGQFDEDERAALSAGGSSPVTPNGTYTIPASASGNVTLTWATLPGITAGATYLRVRISSDTTWAEGSSGGSAEDTASTGLVANGEVEDYQVVVSAVDFGDAPIIASGHYDDTNADGSVTAADTPASHIVVAGIRLGTEDPDGEALTFGDGTDNNTNATDDDSEGPTPDDEDGLVTEAVILSSQSSYSATVLAANSGGPNATVFGWIDFDQSGSFDEDERATATRTTGSGNVTLNWAAMPGLITGTTYARFRITSDGSFVPSGTAATEDVDSLGEANNGEVEDYRFLVRDVDYGDAPFSAAQHGILNTLILGSIAPDADTGNFGNGVEDLANTASDDDTPGDPSGNFDDEDSTTPSPIPEGASSYALNIKVNNTSGSSATLVAWIDFDKDGIWEESERQQTTITSPTVDTISTLSWSGLSGITIGNTFARIRLTSTTLDIIDDADNGVEDDAASTLANDGEVEDYRLVIASATDYGDVPILTGGDYDDGNSANHTVVANLHLGSTVDVDTGPWGDGIDTNQNASDDDSEGATPDDEDGIASLTTIPTSAIGTTYSVPLTLLNNTGSNANVFAWIDFDSSETFDESELASLVDGSIILSGQQVPSSGASGTVNLQWTVPANVVPGQVYMRVRITTDALSAAGGGEDERAAGAATDGEVEDYPLAIQAIDFGDAPDPSGGNAQNDYTTLNANGGPRHTSNGLIYLGDTAAGADADGFEEGTDNNGLASDDDNGGDEGITQMLASGTSFPALDVGASSYSFNINAFNNSGSVARIYAWIDFDQNGTFDEDELAGSNFIGLSSTPSLQVRTVQWSSLPGLVAGPTYMRVRVTSDTPTASGSGEDERSIGALNGGEVEDHLITAGNLDYADAPAPYHTLLADNGPRHTISADLFLGTVLPDLDTDGYSEGSDDDAGDATDDDVEGSGDENVNDLLNATAVFPQLLTTASSYSLNVNYTNQTGSAIRIYAWIDFDQNGTFDVDEAIDGLFGTGTSQVAALTWPAIPSDIRDGTTYARFRISSTPLTASGSGEDVRSLGLLNNGEVEDHVMSIDGVDFGDAPSSYGTFTAGSGPNHTIGNGALFLGTTAPDGEANGFSDGIVNTANATDDDTEGASADEGINQLLGVGSFPVLNSVDTDYSLNVTVNSLAAANLYAWIDFDNNGVFDADERAEASIPGATSGPITLNWGTSGLLGSSLAAHTVVSLTYARFRLRSDSNISPFGNAPDGEVEDYQFTISGGTVISGRVFEDVNYGGGLGRNYSTANGAYTATDVGTIATVELWTSDGSTCTGGTPLATDTTLTDGLYSFSGGAIVAPASYCVRVVSDSVQSNRTGNTGTLVPVQTFRSRSTDGAGSIEAVNNEMGGRFPAVEDSDPNVFNTASTSSWSIVSTNGNAVNNLDFGYSFHTVVNANASAQGSFEQFILNANALVNTNVAQLGQTAGLDTSIFEIPTSDPNYNGAGQSEFTITPTSLLPDITEAISLDATTQSGVSCPNPKVVVNGATVGAGGSNYGLHLNNAGGSTVRGFVINNWGAAGIRIATAGSNQIDCNYLGLEANGVSAAPNVDGIRIASGDSNTIGGVSVTSKNIIAGNSGVGIYLESDQNQVSGNLIGIAADGLSRLENGSHGIVIEGSNNAVGTSSQNAVNIIAYNGGDGIQVAGGASSVQNELRINKIFNNADLGINLASTENNSINRPVITSASAGASDLTLDGDLIVGNGVYTIEFYANPVCNSDQNGTSQSPAAGEGLQFLGSTALVASSGTTTYNFPTVLAGIVPGLVGGQISAKVVSDTGDSSEFSDCFTSVAPQVISGVVREDVNYGGGVGRVNGVGVAATVELWTSDGSNCTGGAPTQAITANAATGAYSFTTVQPGAQYCVRVVNATVRSSRSGWVAGILPVQTYRVAYDADNVGIEYETLTDHVGGESPRDADSSAGVIDVTANDGTRTQALSFIDLPVAGNVPDIDFGFNFSTVVNANSSGQGSLKQFILNANTLGDKASLAQSGLRINAAGTATEALPAALENSIFMISNGGVTSGLNGSYPNLLSGSGVAQISLSAAETISQSDISIDGTTQSQNVFGNNGSLYNSGVLVGSSQTAQGAIMKPEVELSGSALTISAATVQLRGVAFLPTSSALSINAGSNHIIEQNAFGISALSLSEPGSGSTATLVNINNVDGGNLSNNVFAYGDQSGLLFGNGSELWAIDDNLFQGFSQAGMLSAATFSCSSFSRNQATANNIGIQFAGGNASSACLVQNSTFNQNLSTGIEVNVASNTDVDITGNLITENLGDGVLIAVASSAILISQNHIYNNGDLGIDLAGDGLTANDANDVDGGANLLMNFPVVTGVVANGNLATLSGTLDSGQAGPLTVELYSSVVCNGNTLGASQSPNNGEGQVFTTSAVVTDDTPFNISSIDISALAGPFVSLLARDGAGNTSEFGPCFNATLDDYGDAPASYGTLKANNGARHRTNSLIYMGSAVPDAEIDGFVDGIDDSGAAADDDADVASVSDDEDLSPSFATLTNADKSYSISVNNVNNAVGSAAQLAAWIDFDRNGTFDSDEAASISVPDATTNGSFVLQWVESPSGGQGSIPVDIDSGASYVRIRLTTDASILTGTPSTSSSLGFASNGEVEDHPIPIEQGFDYGDAPSGYNSADGNSPARHARGANLIYLGSIPPDGDPADFGGNGSDNGYDPQCVSDPGFGSALDDDCEGLDDEDAAELRGIIPTQTSYTAQAVVTNNSGSGVYVYAWLDTNQNGSFESGEAQQPTATNPINTSGASTVTFNWTGLSMGVGSSYVRFRVSSVDYGTGGFSGDAVDGEVEDYAIIVSQLTCDVIYGQYNDQAGNWPPANVNASYTEVRAYTPDGVGNPDGLGEILSGVLINSNTETANSVGSAASAINPLTRSYFYTEWTGNPDDDAIDQLNIFSYDGANHSGPLVTGGIGSESDNFNRMAFDNDGTGWLVETNTFEILEFNPVTNSVTSRGSIGGTIDGAGGDIAFDVDDRMFMLTYTTTSINPGCDAITEGGGDDCEFYLYEIQNYDSSPTAVQLLADFNATNETIAGIAFYADKQLYMQGSNGTTFAWNLGLNDASNVAAPDVTPGSADLASCIYPNLEPVIDATKTVENLTDIGSPGFAPGERLKYTISIRNTGGILTNATTFIDAIPANTSYVAGSTYIERKTSGSTAPVQVPDISGNFPFLSAAAINSDSQASGVLTVIPSSGSLANTVEITFEVDVDLTTGFDTVCNVNGIVSFDDSSFGDSPVGTNDPTTAAAPGLANGDTETTDPTCIDKISGYAISGSVYSDVDVDQVFDGSEAGISGVTMVLRNDSLGTCQGAGTNGSGFYQFFPLDPGSYTVYEAAGESVAFPACPPTTQDPNGYVSSTANSISVTVVNANVVDQNFGDVQPPLFSPNNSGILQPGNSIVYSHVLSPRTDGAVTFSFTEATIPSTVGWSVTQYIDDACGGSLDGGDTLISGSVAATQGTDICILTRVTAPGGAAAANQHIATVQASFDYPGSFVANAVLTVIDTTTVVSANDGALLLIKTVENITASSPYFDSGLEQVSNEGVPGDELLYRVKFQNVGSAAISDVDIFDTTPAFTGLATIVDCADATIPVGLTCAIIVPTTTNLVGYSGPIQWRLTGSLAASDNGVVVFTVKIE